MTTTTHGLVLVGRPDAWEKIKREGPREVREGLVFLLEVGDRANECQWGRWP